MQSQSCVFFKIGSESSDGHMSVLKIEKGEKLWHLFNRIWLEAFFFLSFFLFLNRSFFF